MKTHSITHSVGYKLLCRLESLITSIETLNDVISDLGQIGTIRYKPLFKTYNSIVDEFRSSFAEEHKKLSLEELPLYDDKGKECFTADKLSTLLHQSKDISALLRGLLPPGDIDLSLPSKITFYWLLNNVPVQFWIWLFGILLSIFICGIYFGQLSWVQELLGKNNKAKASYEQKKGEPTKAEKELPKDLTPKNSQEDGRIH